MSTLTEIEAAANALSAEQKQELLIYLAQRLRSEGGTPPMPRTFPTQQIQEWIDEDNTDMKRVRGAK